jgi:hypothetical protein
LFEPATFPIHRDARGFIGNNNIKIPYARSERDSDHNQTYLLQISNIAPDMVIVSPDFEANSRKTTEKLIGR